jgi:hypothetical protein
MTQAQLERAVALATGETRETIRQRGFMSVKFPKRRSGRRRRRKQRRRKKATIASLRQLQRIDV